MGAASRLGVVRQDASGSRGSDLGDGERGVGHRPGQTTGRVRSAAVVRAHLASAVFDLAQPTGVPVNAAAPFGSWGMRGATLIRQGRRDLVGGEALVAGRMSDEPPGGGDFPEGGQRGLQVDDSRPGWEGRAP